ncbi:MAG: hypothetical protein IKD22_01155 [Lentisphaeria bacterium]|nr:hypothetical protein [Lentisphaeria bacterium]
MNHLMKKLFFTVPAALMLCLFCGCGSKNTADRQLQRAAAHAERNDWHKAREVTAKILKKSPRHSNAQLLMALCLEKNGSLEEAADLARQAAKLRRSDFAAIYTAARLTYLATPARRETFDELEKALLLRPNDLNTLILLCNCGTEISHPRVIRYLQKLEKTGSPDPALLKFQFGAYYAAGKNHAVAKDYFEQAVKLKPESAELAYAAATHLDRGGVSTAVLFYQRFLDHPAAKERAMVDTARQRIDYFRNYRR